MTNPERAVPPLPRKTPAPRAHGTPRATLALALSLGLSTLACGGASTSTSTSASTGGSASGSATGSVASGGASGTTASTRPPGAEAGTGEPPAREPERPDADADGVPDALDRCVHDRGEAVAGGCPPYDPDGDGTPEAWSEFRCAASACSQAYCVREAPAMPVLYFARGRPSGRNGDIPALAAALGAEGDAYISGHTGPGERAELGRERAEWVIARLARSGVDTSRLQAVGFGSHWGKTSPPEGMSAEDADRRVEVHATWYGPPGCSEHEVPADKCPVLCGP